MRSRPLWTCKAQYGVDGSRYVGDQLFVSRYIVLDARRVIRGIGRTAASAWKAALSKTSK